MHVSGHDAQGHVNNSLQVKTVYYVWTKEETEYDFLVIRVSNHS